MGIKYGIRQSLGLIMKNWENIITGKGGEEVDQWWLEASAGFPLTGRVMKSFLGANGDPASSVDDPKGRLKRLIFPFAQASAVAAFTRYHSLFASVVNDHLTLNQNITSAEKAKLYSLMNRVTQQLELAQADVTASYPVENLINGASIAFDRRTMSNMAAATQAAQAGADRAEHQDEQFAFGGVTYFNQNGGGAGAPRGVGALVERSVGKFR